MPGTADGREPNPGGSAPEWWHRASLCYLHDPAATARAASQGDHRFRFSLAQAAAVPDL